MQTQTQGFWSCSLDVQMNAGWMMTYNYVFYGIKVCFYILEQYLWTGCELYRVLFWMVGICLTFQSLLVTCWLTGLMSALVPAWQNPYCPCPLLVGLAAHGSRNESRSSSLVIVIHRPRPHRDDGPTFLNLWAQACKKRMIIEYMNSSLCVNITGVFGWEIMFFECHSAYPLFS